MSSYLQFPVTKEFLVSIGDEIHGKEAFERVMGLTNNIERMLFGRTVNPWLLLRELKRVIASTKANEELQIARAAAMWARGADRVKACALVCAATGEEDDLWLLCQTPSDMRQWCGDDVCRALARRGKLDLARQNVQAYGGWATLAKFSKDAGDLSAAEEELDRKNYNCRCPIRSCIELYVATLQSSWLDKAFQFLNQSGLDGTKRESMLADVFLPAMARVEGLQYALIEVGQLEGHGAKTVAYFRLAETVGDSQCLEEAERMADVPSPMGEGVFGYNFQIMLPDAILGVIRKLVADWKETRDSSPLTRARGLFDRIKRMGNEALVQVVKGHCALGSVPEDSSDEAATWGDALATLRQIELCCGLEPHGEASMAIVQSMLSLLNDSTPPDHRKTYFGRIREIAKAIGHHLWRCRAFLALYEAQKKFEGAK